MQTMDNCSANVCNLSYQVPSPIPYIAISVAHMLVVIVPTVLLGATILYHVYSNREMRDPITTLFCAVIITSMLSPVTFGLLLDMSMITDLPLLGSCSSPSRAIQSNRNFVFFANVHALPNSADHVHTVLCDQVRQRKDHDQTRPCCVRRRRSMYCHCFYSSYCFRCWCVRRGCA